MIRIALPWIAEALAAFETLGRLEPSNMPLHMWLAVTGGQRRLNELYLNSVYKPYLRVSSDHASTLKHHLDEAAVKLGGLQTPLPETDLTAIRFQAETFVEVFKSELGTIPSYLVQPKGSHDVALLTEAGEQLFPEKTADKAPETLVDMKEAGKALAFDLPTACGFHTYRVLEAVLKRYWDEVSSQKSRPKPETIGKFSAELNEGKFGKPAIWETLAQIAKLHRNPLIHPTVVLTTEEALGVLGIVRSAIGSMLQSLPDAPQTTQSAGVTP